MNAQLNHSRDYINAVAPAVRNLANELCPLLGQMKAVALKFDGKVINKRFTDALEQCNVKMKYSNGIEYPKYRYSIKTGWTVTPSAKFEDFEIYFGDSVHVNHESVNLSNLITTGVYFTNEAGKCEAMPERLDAQKFCRMIDQFIERLQVQAMDFEDMRKNYTRYEKAVQKAQEAVNKYLVGIPFHLQPRNVTPDWSLTRNADDERRQKFAEAI